MIKIKLVWANFISVSCKIIKMKISGVLIPFQNLFPTIKMKISGVLTSFKIGLSANQDYFRGLLRFHLGPLVTFRTTFQV